MRRAHDRNGGFTMIEALIAFFVLALLTVTIQRGVSDALTGTARAQNRFGAELTARTLLTSPLGLEAATGTPIEGQMSGYGWRMRFEPLPGDPASVSAAADEPLWRPVRVAIEVRREGSARLLATTETIRLVKDGGS